MFDEGIGDAELVARVARGASQDDAAPPGAKVSGADMAGAMREAEEALEALFTRHGGRVMALARRMLGSRQEAEEVLQDTFMSLYRHAAEFDEARASVSTYLSAIARNLSLSRLRRRKARPRKADGADPHDVAFQAAVGVPDDPLPGILVRDALSRLEPDERDLLDDAFFLGYSHAEVAERRGLPLGTVKSRIRRALLKLRHGLERGGS